MIKKGFLLSKSNLDFAQSSRIILWLSSDEGPCQLCIDNEPAVFFIHSDDTEKTKAILTDQIVYRIKALPLKTFHQQKVSALYFQQQQHFFNAQRLLNDAAIPIFEHDFRLCDRFLMERFIYGGMAFTGTATPKNGYVQYTNVKVKPDHYLPNLTVLSIDIECSMQGELYCIGLFGNNKNPFQKVIMISNTQQAAHPLIDWVANEKALLQHFETLFNAFNPDIIIGWNVIDFDFKLLLQRAKLLNISLRLGRDNSVCQWRDSNKNDQGFITIAGRMVIDGISALKSATYQFSSFSLDNVANQLLGKSKLTQNVYHRADEITYNFYHNKIQLAQYNIRDCELVADIFTHTKVLDFLLFRSQITGLELNKQGGSIPAFTQLYLPKLHRAGYIAPNLPSDGGLASPGGYVMNSLPGLYRNVIVLDFKSLYPSIIRTFKIDPLGLIEGLLDKNDAIEGFCGAYFSREKHFLPNMITALWQQRDLAKQQKDEVKSQAIKIIMNSFYGVLGSGSCRFYDTRLASSITLRGHAIIQQTQEWLEQLGYSVIYGDTDSLFISLNDHYSTTEVSNIAKALVSEINDNWQHKLQEELQLDSHLEIEFDQHYLRFFMPTIRGSEQGSKKRYAGLIANNHSTDNKHTIIFKGLENVRTDWTPLARDFQYNLFEHIFNDKNPVAFISTTLTELRAGLLDDKLVYRKRLRQKLSDYIKNVPPHVKAARIADTVNLANNLPLQYQKKGWIEYVITMAGPEPVEYRKNALDYSHYIEKQLMPIADAILPFVGIHFSFDTEYQRPLF